LPSNLYDAFNRRTNVARLGTGDIAQPTAGRDVDMPNGQ